MTGCIAVEFSSLTLSHLQVGWGNGGSNDKVWGREGIFLDSLLAAHSKTCLCIVPILLNVLLFLSFFSFLSIRGVARILIRVLQWQCVCVWVGNVLWAGSVCVGRESVCGEGVWGGCVCVGRECACG